MLLMMATAFMGYVLPWGQMSFWGATVITNLFSALPIIGEHIVTWLWGGFSVDNPTLNRFRVDGIIVDLQARKVTGRQGSQVHLTSTEFELLATLMRGRNNAISRDQLLEGVFGRGWSPFDRSIDVHVANLRRKIEIDPKNPEIIKTVRGTGYVLVGPVEVMSQPLPA